MMRINLALFAVLVVCALALVTSQHRARRLINELEEEQQAALRLDVEWGKLQLEQSTWAMRSRIEHVASANLQMRVPPQDRVRMVPTEPTRQGRRP